jgi:hypothetical protein
MTRSRVFLLVVAATFIPIFALPLFIDPIWWAERFGWETEGPRDLTVYLGRCLGAVALAISFVALRASGDPPSHRWLFDLLAAGGALLAVVHLRGVFEEDQPLVEDLEVVMYAAFALAAWLCRPRSTAATR